MVELDNESMAEDVIALRQMVLEKREKLLAENQGTYLLQEPVWFLIKIQRQSLICCFFH